MKRLLAVLLIMLGMARATPAQGQASDLLGSSHNPAVDFATTSAPSARVPKTSDGLVASLTPPEPSLAALSFSTPGTSPASLTAFAPTVSIAAPAAAPPEPSPASPSPYNYLERDYRWEIGLGFALVRFRSNAFYSTAPGFNSQVSYYLNNWLAIEGSVTTAWAPKILSSHVKYLGYGAGPKFSLGRKRLEPWVHALVGGVHVIPQTALGGQNGFELTAGGGVDWGWVPRLSIRLELDYLRSNLYSQSQNSAQGILGVAFHF